MRGKGIFHVKKKTGHIRAHFTEYMKTAYQLIKPISSHSRDIYFLIIILIIIINIILAAAQIYNFLRLESVNIHWLGTSE